MKYVHMFTFQFPYKLASYTIQSENRILKYTQLEKLLAEQNIDLITSILINHTVFLNEENN